MRRMGCFAKIMIILAVAPMLYLLGMLRPFIWTFPEQDRCSFGPVSNDRYRELLAIAKREKASEVANQSPREMKNAFQRRFDRLLESTDGSVYEKIAAIHAVARSDYGQYRSIDSGGHQEFPEFWKKTEPDFRKSKYIAYRYYIWEIKERFFFYPIIRGDILFSGILYYKDLDITSTMKIKAGTIEVAARYWHIFERNTYVERSKHHPDCPPVPSAEWVEKFNAYSAANKDIN